MLRLLLLRASWPTCPLPSSSMCVLRSHSSLSSLSLQTSLSLSSSSWSWLDQQRRYLGRGRPIQAFGHSKKRQPNEMFSAVTLLIVFASTLAVVVDWDEVERLSGFRMPFLTSPEKEDMLKGEKAKFKVDFRLATRQMSELDHILINEKEDIKRFLLQHPDVREDYGITVEELEKSGEEDDVNSEVKQNQRFKDYLLNQTTFQVKAEEDPHGNNQDDHLLKRKPVLKDNMVLETKEVSAEDSIEGFNAAKSSKGFRARKIVEYENRIRQYSTPDKIFRYFASYKIIDSKGHSEVMMSPIDFLRSITPGMKQPEHLGLDQFANVEARQLTTLADTIGVKEDSIFYQLGAGGLISFSDYIFLLTVLSTSRRHFEIAFKMFDLNGDGNIDAREFERVNNIMRNQSSVGAKHRDHTNTGSTIKGINSGLMSYFFGTDFQKLLTIEAFIMFQETLQNEILTLEFERKSKGNDVISERDFADLLIAYAGFPDKKRARMLKRVKKHFGKDTKESHDEDNSDNEKSKGITLDDYLSFFRVLYSMSDIDTALTFYHMAGAPIGRATMKHVARTVSKVELSDHVVDVVFVLFDENGDGMLSNREFVAVMKQRAMRGLEKPKDTGIGRIFAAVSKCASEAVPTILGGVRRTE